MKFFLFSFCIAGLFAFNFNDDLYSQNYNQAILQPDKTLGRTCKVYSNTLIIRFKKTIRAEEPLLRTYIIHYNSDIAPEKYAKQLLKSNPDVEIAEPYCLDEIQGTPNDPYYNSQTMLKTIHAVEAWDSGLSGDSSVVIGISDNGIKQNHEDLINSIAPNWGEIPGNDFDDDSNNYTDDFMGYNLSYSIDNEEPDNTYFSASDHGTNVAGIAGATVNNNIGIAGVANKCRIFPIKSAQKSDGDTYLSFGYESIKYAAERKLKVLNCSWGVSKMPSDIDQSRINYAVANDVAVIVAGGNKKLQEAKTTPYYPAGYNNVLGVGEVDQNDFVSDITTLGYHIDIMAPGRGNYYTTNGFDIYANSDGGTSLASPVVAASVALVRAKYPELNALQSLEFIRQCTDDITNKNPSYKDILPGRLNLLKATQIEPMSIPSIRPISFELFTNNDILVERGNVGDSLKLKINAYNYLGSVSNLRFVLSPVNDPNYSIEVIDSVVNISEWLSNSPDIIQTFKFIINSRNENRMFFRIDIYADNGYHDFFLLPFIPSSEVTTFVNKSIKFSVADRGNFGFGGNDEDNKQGVGFIYKNYGNQIYTNAGIMAVENNSKAISSIFGTSANGNDFAVVKPFTNPIMYRGVINDSPVSINNRIGLEIEQSFHFVSDTLPATKILLSVKNVSNTVLNDVAIGYFLDWDIGPDEAQNRVRLFPEAIPETFAAISAAAELARYEGDYPVVAAACYSPNITYEAQAAGFNTPASSVTEELQIQALTNGTTMQYDEIGDVKMVIGMKFPGEMQPGETKKCTVCIGAGEDEVTLAQTMKECMLGTVGVEENPLEQDDISIYPQPAKDMINVRINSEYQKIVLRLYDCLGIEVIQPIKVNSESGKQIIPINIYSLPSGMYYLTAQIGFKLISKPVIILK